MKIVIDIPKEMIFSLEQGSFGAKYNMYDLISYVMNGTPLPEGHGRLGDLDALEVSMRYEVLKHDLNEYGCLGLVSRAPTIIEGSDSE